MRLGARHALARSDLLVALVAGVTLVAILLPVFGRGRVVSDRQVSADNLRTIHIGLECYAADWNKRQWTAIPDVITVAGSPITYEWYPQQKHYVDAFGNTIEFRGDGSIGVFLQGPGPHTTGNYQPAP